MILIFEQFVDFEMMDGFTKRNHKRQYLKLGGCQC